MSKPWGSNRTWAEEAEQAEAEEREAAAAAGASGTASAESQSFPSLKEAASAKQKKKKLTLSEFHTIGSGGGVGSRVESKGLTHDELLRLPTHPKERSADETSYGRLGGGFSHYGRPGLTPVRGMRDREDTDGSWGSGGGRRQYGGGFDEERRGPPPSRVSDYDQPSRADEDDNWTMGKKPLPSFDSGRQSRYGSLGGGSRADGVDNWTVNKKPLPVRSSPFGSSFREPGPEPDRWTRGGFREPDRDRRRLTLDPPRGDVAVNETVKTNKPSPFGAGRPREEVLAEKGFDWKKMEMEIEAKKTQSSRPTSAQSSRPSSAHSSRSEAPGLQQQVQEGLDNVMVKQRPKVNPFGDAKPREVLLQERGQDWRKIDLELEHRSVDRPETNEEKLLKKEIDDLKKELQREYAPNANRESQQGSGEGQRSLQKKLALKEMELEKLIHDLDDKVRFGQKAVERPGSGAGRATGFPERPPSRSGSFDESRSMESMDRPRSRGKPDIWTRPGDDRRSFHGGRDRGFLGSRDFDRPGTRERW